MFKAWLEGAVSNLVWLKMSMFFFRGVGLLSLRDPFQVKLFYDSNYMIFFYHPWKHPEKIRILREISAPAISRQVGQ